VLTDVQAVFAGAYYSLFLRSDGSIWGCGYNAYGQLAHQSEAIVMVPRSLVPRGVSSAAAGACHSIFVMADGTAWTIGDNSYGQLGDGTLMSRRDFVQVFSGVREVSASAYHSLFLKVDGTVWAAGLNSYGQLGDNSTIDKHFPVQVLTDCQHVAAGYYSSIFVQTNGTAWGAGYNGYGELGDGSSVSSMLCVRTLFSTHAPADVEPAPPNGRAGDARLEMRELQNDWLVCQICFEARAPCVLLPCRHQSFCDQCATQVFHSNAPLCPICRADILEVMQTFIG